MRTLYDVLGVDPVADATAIRSGFIGLAKDHHPDRNPGDETAAQRFREICAAYEILKHAQSRQAYDDLLHQSRRTRRRSAALYAAVFVLTFCMVLIGTRQSNMLENLAAAAASPAQALQWAMSFILSSARPPDATEALRPAMPDDWPGARERVAEAQMLEDPLWATQAPPTQVAPVRVAAAEVPMPKDIPAATQTAAAEDMAQVKEEPASQASARETPATVAPTPAAPLPTRLPEARRARAELPERQIPEASAKLPAMRPEKTSSAEVQPPDARAPVKPRASSARLAEGEKQSDRNESTGSVSDAGENAGAGRPDAAERMPDMRGMGARNPAYLGLAQRYGLRVFALAHEDDDGSRSVGSPRAGERPAPVMKGRHARPRTMHRYRPFHIIVRTPMGIIAFR